MTGYLNVLSAEYTEQGIVCTLMIPNKEVRSLYRNIIERRDIAQLIESPQHKKPSLTKQNPIDHCLISCFDNLI